MTGILILFIAIFGYCNCIDKEDAPEPAMLTVKIPYPSVPLHARMLPQDVERLRNQPDEVQPGLFEGDIAIDEGMYKQWRLGLRWTNNSHKYWPGKTIPYLISDLYNNTAKQIIQAGINKINFMSCVKFIPWDGKATDYIHIQPVENPGGCWSYVGRRGGEQPLGLRAPGCVMTLGTPMHELMHALGTFHEQSRWDRDDHVIIHRDNIIPRTMKNFDQQSYNKAFTKYQYDYNSIMHYGRHYFALDRSKPTLSPKREDGSRIGQRDGLSVLDCFKLNELYGCFDDNGPNYRRICEKFGEK